MNLIDPAQLRQLVQLEYPSGTNLLALVSELASLATTDFVMTRKHFHQIYNTRLGISRNVTGKYIEGLAEAVTALAETPEQDIRLINSELKEGRCVIFAAPDLHSVIGVMFFK
jgi:hypothetical protein